MTVTSGLICSALSKKSGPLGCLARMLLASSRWNSTVVYLTWKVSATPAKRLLYRLAPRMPSTDGIGYGLWQTPAAQRSGASEEGLLSELRTKDGEPAKMGQRAYAPGRKNHIQLTLDRQVKMWPTPNSNETCESVESVMARKERYRRERPDLKNPSLVKLGTAVKMGPTPPAGQLNPTWVCWLQGYPLDWLDGVSGPKNRKKSPASPSESPKGSTD